MEQFNTFFDLREFIRRYNSTSILKIGTRKCWRIWEYTTSNTLDWTRSNAERNYAIRLMLLASAGNQHRRNDMSAQLFDDLVNAYHNWSKHTISSKEVLEDEANLLLFSIQKWESEHNSIVRNWTFNISSILNFEIIRAHIAGLFIQRIGAFQNAGFGKQSSRITRAIKFIEILDNKLENKFSSNVLINSGLSLSAYFKHFLACLALFGQFSETKGFYNFEKPIKIDKDLQTSEITSKTLEIFIEINSTSFHSKAGKSFRSILGYSLDKSPAFYQPFFYNYLLETPLIKLERKRFCMPDPFSFTESCWNKISSLASSKDLSPKKLNNVISRTFEGYLEKILLPFICASSFRRIPEVKHPSSSKDKRADFLIKTEAAHIIIECKNSVMHSDVGAYFQADKVAELWCRIHFACEQISATVEALELYDKPVIPIILTFYDSIAASSVFEEVVKQTDYCSLIGLRMPPVICSIHEFEHWISYRSLDNWSKFVLAKQGNSPPIPSDNQGHDYGRLNNIPLL